LIPLSAAAKRRKNAAHGASRGKLRQETTSPEGAKEDPLNHSRGHNLIHRLSFGLKEESAVTSKADTIPEFPLVEQILI
jgi:hypothetical protein